MSLISGFAAVNQAEQAGGSEQRQLTLEAQEARAITAWEQALALIAAQRDEEAQVGAAGIAPVVLGRWVAQWRFESVGPAALRSSLLAEAGCPGLPPSMPSSCTPSCHTPQAALRALLDDPAVDGCATDQLHRIKFLSLRNLAELLARQGTATAHEALAVYCQATQVGQGGMGGACQQPDVNSRMGVAWLVCSEDYMVALALVSKNDGGPSVSPCRWWMMMPCCGASWARW